MTGFIVQKIIAEKKSEVATFTNFYYNKPKNKGWPLSNRFSPHKNSRKWEIVIEKIIALKNWVHVA